MNEITWYQQQNITTWFFSRNFTSSLYMYSSAKTSYGREYQWWTREYKDKIWVHYFRRQELFEFVLIKWDFCCETNFLEFALNWKGSFSTLLLASLSLNEVDEEYFIRHFFLLFSRQMLEKNCGLLVGGRGKEAVNNASLPFYYSRFFLLPSKHSTRLIFFALMCAFVWWRIFIIEKVTNFSFSLYERNRKLNETKRIRRNERTDGILVLLSRGLFCAILSSRRRKFRKSTGLDFTFLRTNISWKREMIIN